MRRSRPRTIVTRRATGRRNADRFDAGPCLVVSRYGLIIESHDPRLVGPVREELERLLTSGVKVHGLQRLLGDAYMQQGAYERAIESYSLAFDELRSRQITEGIRA